MKNSIVKLRPEDVQIDDFGGQMRTSGISRTHIQDLVHSLKNLGQQKPISVEQFGGTFTCLDGHHRVVALRQINEEQEEQLMVEAKVFSGLDSLQRKKLQLTANAHLPARVSSMEDVVSCFTSMVRFDNACGDLQRFETDKRRIKEIQSLIEICIPGEHRAAKIAKKVFRELPNISGFKKLKNYTSQCARKEFNASNSEGYFLETGNGEVCGDRIFYFAPSSALLSAQWSLAQTKKSKFPNAQVEVVSWLGDAEGKSPQDVRDWRTRVVQLCKERNSWTASGPLGKIIYRVRFLEQILQCPDGSDQRGVIEVVEI